MKSLLIITNYFPPEKGAAANRIGTLASSLQRHGYDVHVVCPLANYPEGKLFEGYRGVFRKAEHFAGVRITRLWIYPSNSKNPVKRIFSTASFALGLFFYLLYNRLPEKVIVQSPPLLLSFISVVALRLRRRHIILNVSDLWPSAAIELGVLKKGSISHKLLVRMERFIYRNASVILGQSEEILAHARPLSNGVRTHLYRNFPDQSPIPQWVPEKKLRVFYAGLLGVAQGVYDAVCEITLPENVELHIFGDGAERKKIESFIAANPDKPVFYHGMLSRSDLHQRLAHLDLAFVPLKTRINGSVPSKIFEYARLGVPLLYCGGGEGEALVSTHQLGWTAPAGDWAAVSVCLEEISRIPPEDWSRMRKEIAAFAAANFDPENQLRELIAKGIF